MKLVNAVWVTVAVMGGFVCLAGGNHSAAFKDAQTKGADARVRLCVHDERGTPIAGASIRATLANRESDYSMHGVTDTNGGASEGQVCIASRGKVKKFCMEARSKRNRE